METRPGVSPSGSDRRPAQEKAAPVRGEGGLHEVNLASSFKVANQLVSWCY